MSKVTHLYTGSTDLTPEMALADAQNFELSDVVVVGYEHGELVVRSSHMSRAEAAFLLMQALDHARGVNQDE